MMKWWSSKFAEYSDDKTRYFQITKQHSGFIIRSINIHIITEYVYYTIGCGCFMCCEVSIIPSLVWVFLKGVVMSHHVNNSNSNIFNNCTLHKSQIVYTYQQQHTEQIKLIKQQHERQIQAKQIQSVLHWKRNTRS